MDKPKSIMMWRASEKMSKILSAEYLLGGSNNASLWSLGDQAFDQEFKTLSPGTLILLFRTEQERNFIVGGAYFLGWKNFSVSEAWELYGVYNGALNYDDFVNDVKARGGNDKSILSVALLAHIFMFEKNDYIHIPEELSDSLSLDHEFILSLSEPAGRYLHTRVLETRDNYISAEGADWHGLYYAASHRNSKSYVAEFYSRVLNAYNFTCALSGVQARPVLSIAHIQPFYDSKFQTTSNGLVLRSDLFALFKSGYITFEYKDNNSKIVCKVSATVRTAYGEDYMAFDGKELKLPQDKSAWPEPKYLTWHNRNCFERWLKACTINGCK